MFSDRPSLGISAVMAGNGIGFLLGPLGAGLLTGPLGLGAVPAPGLGNGRDGGHGRGPVRSG